jgi:hypothetical protein
VVQVMRFFSEQRRDTEETMAAQNMKKKAVMGDIRKFFSQLIKVSKQHVKDPCCGVKTLNLVLT